MIAQLKQAANKVFHFMVTDKATRIFLTALLFFFLNLLVEYPLREYYGQHSYIFCKWDCLWYKTIVENGYQTFSVLQNGQANSVFFPLLPLLAKGLVFLIDCSAEFALLFVSKYMFFFCIWIFIYFVQSVFKDIPPSIAAATITFMPFAVHSATGYTETVFFVLVMLVFLTFHEKKYVQTAFFGALLSASKTIGVLIVPALALPLVFCFWKYPLKEKINLSLTFMLMPLGLFVFMFYLYENVGDALAFSHVQIAWSELKCFPKPFCSFWRSLNAPLTSYHFWGAIGGLFCFWASFFLFRKKKPDLAIFLIFCTLSPLMFRTISPRYILWNPCFLLVVCYLLNKYRRWLYIILPVMAALMMQTYFYFIGEKTPWPI